MRLWNGLNVVVLPAFLSVLGIVMMLVVDSAWWDKVMLFLAALPILLACHRIYALRRKRQVMC
ncbi:hypothetical protein [Stutzerimonas kirkiae]|uniref:hypothetical protein n=1 Tax=Stutzerimonas kirkiae TaxID=2211392 RepID=UPI0010383B99|nr:hypothetical protein [Stutzerimonas kirkiae]TBV07529.1 hypothetical protein DNK08_12600 [Stutzerimonas kirkiae]